MPQVRVIRHLLPGLGRCKVEPAGPEFRRDGLLEMLLLFASAGRLPQHSLQWRKKGKRSMNVPLESISRLKMDVEDDLTVRVEARGTEKGGPSIGRTG